MESASEWLLLFLLVGNDELGAAVFLMLGFSAVFTFAAIAAIQQLLFTDAFAYDD